VAVLAAIAVDLVDPGIDPSRVVVSVIIVGLAGMTWTGAVQDALTGSYVTAAGRFFEASVNTAGLIVGIKLGMLIADRSGVDLAITANVSAETRAFAVHAIGSCRGRGRLQLRGAQPGADHPANRALVSGCLRRLPRRKRHTFRHGLVYRVRFRRGHRCRLLHAMAQSLSGRLRHRHLAAG
jgi:Putative threonine/serine exporter